MKGKVFIGWSSDNSLALKVKAELKKNDYNGIVGGKAERSLEHGVGDTIIKQMRSCSAAIMLFTSRTDTHYVCTKCNKILGGKKLSGNMLFELGFLKGSLMPDRVFTVFIDDAVEYAPFDLKGIWDLHIERASMSEESLAEEITKCFLLKQYNALSCAKIDMIADYSHLKNLIVDHLVSPVYYENEMAEIIIMYSRSAYLFGNARSACDFLNEVLHSDIDDDRMLLAVNSAIVYLKAICELEKDDDGKLFLSKKSYMRYSKDLKSYLEDAEQFPESDDFRLLLEMTVYSTLCFLNMVYYSGKGCDEGTYALEREVCVLAIESAHKFENADKQKNELFGVIYETYAYRNFAFLCKSHNSLKEAEDAFEKSISARRRILDYYNSKDFDKTIFLGAESEYYLALTDDIESICASIRADRIHQLKEYVERIKEVSYDRTYLVRKIDKILTDERMVDKRT